MHLTFLASNTDHRTTFEVFHPGQMQLYPQVTFFFLKNYVFGDVWKLSSAIIKGVTNSLLVKQTKWPQRRRKTMVKGNISWCQSKFILPHTTFQDFSEKLSLVESLHKEKLQLSSGPVCFVLCCDNIKSNCQ